MERTKGDVMRMLPTYGRVSTATGSTPAARRATAMATTLALMWLVFGVTSPARSAISTPLAQNLAVLTNGAVQLEGNVRLEDELGGSAYGLTRVEIGGSSVVEGFIASGGVAQISDGVIVGHPELSGSNIAPNEHPYVPDTIPTVNPRDYFSFVEYVMCPDATVRGGPRHPTNPASQTNPADACAARPGGAPFLADASNQQFRGWRMNGVEPAGPGARWEHDSPQQAFDGSYYIYRGSADLKGQQTGWDVSIFAEAYGPPGGLVGGDIVVSSDLFETNAYSGTAPLLFVAGRDLKTGTLTARGTLAAHEQFDIGGSNPFIEGNVIGNDARNTNGSPVSSNKIGGNPHIRTQAPPPAPPAPPVLRIDKTGPATAQVGDTVTYDFDVTVTGGAAANVSVGDPRCGGAALSRTGGDANSNNNLDPGETWTYTCDYTIKASDPDPLPNTATVTGTGPNNESLRAQDSHSIDVASLPTPVITIDKSGPGSARVGDQIRYEFTVSVSGGSASNVSVSDPRCGNAPLVRTGGDANNNNVLDPGESWNYLCNYTIKATDPDPLPNTATATATGPNNETIRDQDTHQVDVSPALSPLISINKTGPASARVGDSVTYNFAVTVSDGAATNVSVTDPRCGSAPLVRVFGDSNFNNTLDKGETWTYSCNYRIKATDPDPLPNTATVTATGPNNETLRNEDSHSIDIATLPAIDIVKTGPASATRGDTIRYDMLVTSTGGVALSNVAVTDPKCDGGQPLTRRSGDANGNGLLDPDETWLYRCDYTIAATDANPLLNTATARGTGPNGQEAVDSDDHSVAVTDAAVAGIKVNKKGPGEAQVGDVVTYTIEVSLPAGALPLSDVTVTDAMCGSAPRLTSKAGGDDDALLEAGERWTWECTRRITSFDPKRLRNVADAEGTTPGGTVVSAQDDHVLDVVPHPRINVSKSGPNEARVGDVITYTITVSTPVDRPLRDVTVRDPRCDGAPRLQIKRGGDADKLLEPGETWVFTCTHRVTTGDPTPLRNTATGSGTDAAGVTVRDQATHSTEISAVAGKRIIGGPLPFTGQGLSIMIVGLGMVAAGFALIAASGRRRKRVSVR